MQKSTILIGHESPAGWVNIPRQKHISMNIAPNHNNFECCFEKYSPEITPFSRKVLLNDNSDSKTDKGIAF
ncbi:hypothetical protein SDC9_204653 [bioreactor metagenome]|uniref:Uncharacterized protein n=1 Tax=bioreactor metagenome TaxID=1076179 RepID=A0A645J2L7_9ZZZZ